MPTSIVHSIEDIGLETWQTLQPSTVPFLNFQFIRSLEKSQAIGEGTGWQPRFLSLKNSDQQALLYYFEKDNSFGEYIFDWQWVDAYHSHGMPYFPKHTSMIPFTPVTTPHFIMKEYDESLANRLLDEYEQSYQESNSSSSHFLFLSHHELSLFEQRGYLIRDSFQYHFFNEGYESFDALLKTFKGQKAKQIRKERRFPEDLEISSFTAGELTGQHALQMYRFYQSTTSLKGGIEYLNQEFFSLIFDTMKDQILYVQASVRGQAIAGALYFYDAHRLYGRYWGACVDYPHLHFELCYYRGIEFCISLGLAVFEAGAQGEHKISRGFRPTKTYSAHRLKHPAFQKAVKEFIAQEKMAVATTLESLKSRLPFNP